MAVAENRRVILIVLDSVGAGEAPDAAAYGDVGSNTLGNIAAAMGGLHLPNLQKLGLGNILPLVGVPAVAEPAGAFGRMQEISCGKDTTAGHWGIGWYAFAKSTAYLSAGFSGRAAGGV